MCNAVIHTLELGDVDAGAMCSCEADIAEVISEAL